MENEESNNVKTNNETNENVKAKNKQQNIKILILIILIVVLVGVLIRLKLRQKVVDIATYVSPEMSMQANQSRETWSNAVENEKEKLQDTLKLLEDLNKR